MAVFDLFGKKSVSETASYTLNYSVHPIRLLAHKNDFAELTVSLTNDFDKELLTSLVVSLQKTLGFDRSALSREREIRLGFIQPRETKTLRVRVWATQRTAPGDYASALTAVAHYRDYGHVLNETRRMFSLRVV